MPHSGRIKKIICESVTYLDKNKIIDKLNSNFLISQKNLLKKHFGKEDYKNDLLETILNKLNFTYENNEEKENIFKIVKFKKAFTEEERNRRVGIPFLFNVQASWLNVSYPTRKFTWKGIEIERTKYILTIMKILNNETIPLNEGDTININITSFGFNNRDYIRDFIRDKKTINEIINISTIRLMGEINFNFTFLIELDPL